MEFRPDFRTLLGRVTIAEFEIGALLGPGSAGERIDLLTSG
jgi:hypothetical protein